MKKIISICLIVTAITACNNKAKQEATILQAKQMVIDSITKVDETRKAEDVRKKVVDSMSNVSIEQHQRERVVVHKTYSNDGVNTATTTNTTTTTETKKKGWNGKLKGAVIGAGVGAVTGAMIDKKKGEGAVVGGLLGAGVGLGVGAIIDGKKKE